MSDGAAGEGRERAAEPALRPGIDYLHFPFAWPAALFASNGLTAAHWRSPPRLMATATSWPMQRFEPVDWRGARVGIVCDLVNCGLGDRVLLAQFAHAIVEAGASPMAIYTCPPKMRGLPAQVQMRDVILRLFPPMPLAEVFWPKDHDIVFWFGGVGADDFKWRINTIFDAPPDSPRSSELARSRSITCGAWAERALGLRLSQIPSLRAGVSESQPRNDPNHHLDLSPRILIQLGGTSHAAAAGVALRAARERVKDLHHGVELAAIGHADGTPLPEGVNLDLRGQSASGLIDVIASAAEGFGPESGPAHIAGFCSVKWTAYRLGVGGDDDGEAGCDYPRWWLGDYESVEIVIG